MKQILNLFPMYDVQVMFEYPGNCHIIHGYKNTYSWFPMQPIGF